MPRLPHLCTVIAIVFSLTTESRAAEPSAIGKSPVDRMIDLNRRAYFDIKGQRFQAARYWLTEAQVISETAALEHHEMTARTYIHLAVVQLTGLRNREEAVRNFVLALKINPNITITEGLETAALKSAYLQAREQLELPPNPDLTAPIKAPATKTALVELPPTKSPALGDNDITNEPDPDLPARAPAPLFCKVHFEVPRDKDLLIRCATQKQQKRARATLYYRPDGIPEKYVALPMSRSPKGWLIAVIPSRDLVGKSISYYAKAHLPGSQLAIYNGYPETPISILLKGPSTAERQKGDAGSTHPGNGKRWRRRPAKALWLGLGIGSGTVYHRREAVDSTRGSAGEPIFAESGFSPAMTFQIEPELGYQLTRSFSLSLMGRYQYAPADSSGIPAAPAVPTSALAGFARGQLFFGSSGNFQPFASLGFGIGRSFLAVISKRCPAGSCPLDHSDTLHGGWLGFLAGIGILYNFSPRLGITVDLKEIVTAPKALALTELNVGLAFAYDLATRTAPGGNVRTSPLATPKQ